jgi:hypothetical protein
MLNGHALTGEMFLGLAQAYIEAINTGNVPNIEGAWTYVCKNECQKSLGECVEQFNNRLQEAISDKIETLTPETLKEISQ